MSSPSYPVSTIAKLFNLTERRVQQLAKEGVIPKANKGKYELVPCVQGYIHYLQERALGKDAAPQDTYTERARLLKAQADKTELEVGTLKGNLIPIEQAETTWQGFVTACRARLLSIPAKSAHQIITLKEVKEIERFLKRNITEALAELAAYEPDTPSNSEGSEELCSATGTDSEPVVGHLPKAKPRGKCRTRKVDNGKSGVSKRNDGRGKRAGRS
nr:hypothetical protein 17 [bacterium]